MAPNTLLLFIPFILCSQFQATHSPQTNTTFHLQDWSHHGNSTMVPIPVLVTRLGEVDMKEPIVKPKRMKRKRVPNLFQNRSKSRLGSRSRSRRVSDKVSLSYQAALYQIPMGVRLFFMYFLKLLFWPSRKSVQKSDEKDIGVIGTNYSIEKTKKE